MPDDSPKGVFEKATAKKGPGDTLKGNKHRQQIIAGAGILMVLIAYLTYRKMTSNKAAGDGGATISTVSDNQPPTLPITTATNVPSGGAAPQTTTPFAMPTDTTGGGSIPLTSGTPTEGAPSATVPPVKAAPPVGPAIPPAASTAPAQTVTPPAAAHPALLAPAATPHPANVPTTATPVQHTPHPATASGTVV